MYGGKLVFAQLMGHLPLHTLRRCVARYPGRYPTLTFSHLDQFLAMACAHIQASCITSAFAAASREARSPTPTRNGIGASIAIWP